MPTSRKRNPWRPIKVVALVLAVLVFSLVLVGLDVPGAPYLALAAAFACLGGRLFS